MTAILTNTRERTRFLRFSVVGLIGFVVDSSTFFLSSRVLHIFPGVAQAISFTLAVVSNFTWNRYWTYPDSRAKAISRQLIQFFVVNAVGLVVIRTPLFTALELPFRNLFIYVVPPIPYFTPAFLGDGLTLVVVVLVVMLWNFFVNRYWTYNDIE
jgi:putative flippase GtrA